MKTTVRSGMGGVEGLMGTLEKVTTSMESLVITSRALEDNLYCAKVQYLENKQEKALGLIWPITSCIWLIPNSCYACIVNCAVRFLVYCIKYMVRIVQ